MQFGYLLNTRQNNNFSLFFDIYLTVRLCVQHSHLLREKIFDRIFTKKGQKIFENERKFFKVQSKISEENNFQIEEKNVQ